MFTNFDVFFYILIYTDFNVFSLCPATTDIILQK